MHSLSSPSAARFSHIGLATTAHFRPGLLILASVLSLVASATLVRGQTQSSSANPFQTSEQAEICVPDSESSKGTLTLAHPKTQPSGDENGAADRTYTLKATSESSQIAVVLSEPGEADSTGKSNDPICKKTTDSAEPTQSKVPGMPEEKTIPTPPSPIASAITYANGELSVNAADIPLRDLIEDIRTRTGIAVEFPRDTSESRVYDHFGPAPLRDALAQLLYGSGFDYVIQSSPKNPEDVTKLVLSKQPHFVTTEMAPRTLRAKRTTDEVVTTEPTVSYNDVAAQHPRVQNLEQLGIPENFNLQKAAAAAGKSPGQILDELQKRQQEILDAQAPPQ